MLKNASSDNKAIDNALKNIVVLFAKPYFLTVTLTN